MEKNEALLGECVTLCPQIFVVGCWVTLLFDALDSTAQHAVHKPQFVYSENFLAADWTVSLCYLPILLAIQRKLHQIRFSTSSARPSEQLDIVYAEVNRSSSGAL